MTLLPARKLGDIHVGGFANSKVSFIRANVSVKFPDVTDTIARIKDTGSGTILQGALYVKIKDPF